MTTGGKSYSYLTDALGSVIALTDESGVKVTTHSLVEARGVLVTAREAVGLGDLVRSCRAFDAAGFEARYYDPHMTCFAQPGPSGQEKNSSLYGEGEPVYREL
ncbi:hypothetical protein ABZ626_11070 [Streptomyces longispororuber]